MKITTKTGDQGMTSLFSGQRVSKHHIRIEANGDVDELNAAIGVLAAALRQQSSDIFIELQDIQSDLLSLGAWLSITSDSSSAMLLSEFSNDFTKKLETAMDQMEKKIPDLKGFVLPGGHGFAAQAHVARTVCRRAERRVVALVDKTDKGMVYDQLQKIVIYLNRLSDYLFVLARYCNEMMKVGDVLWQK
jgi:cob(I)alamin adenosyltransferase